VNVNERAGRFLRGFHPLFFELFEDVVDEVGQRRAVLVGGEVLPHGKLAELEGASVGVFGLGGTLALRGLLAFGLTPGLVQRGAVDPLAFELVPSAEQGLDALDARPVLRVADEAFLDTVGKSRGLRLHRQTVDSGSRTRSIP
jgi:hypothetical protein